MLEKMSSKVSSSWLLVLSSATLLVAMVLLDAASGGQAMSLTRREAESSAPLPDHPSGGTDSSSSTTDSLEAQFRRQVEQSANQKTMIDRLTPEEAEHHRRTGQLPERTIALITKFLTEAKDSSIRVQPLEPSPRHPTVQLEQQHRYEVVTSSHDSHHTSSTLPSVL